jgi:hypothetical protein
MAAATVSRFFGRHRQTWTHPQPIIRLSDTRRRHNRQLYVARLHVFRSTLSPGGLPMGSLLAAPNGESPVGCDGRGGFAGAGRSRHLARSPQTVDLTLETPMRPGGAVTARAAALATICKATSGALHRCHRRAIDQRQLREGL